MKIQLAPKPNEQWCIAEVGRVAYFVDALVLVKQQKGYLFESSQSGWVAEDLGGLKECSTLPGSTHTRDPAVRNDLRPGNCQTRGP